MLKWLAVAGAVLSLDQITKWVVLTQLVYREEVSVLPFFKWVRWHNDGAAFSFLSGAGGWQHWLFVALASGFSAYLLWELRRLSLVGSGQGSGKSNAREDRYLGWVYSLILGGALGNLFDRLNHGYVVDFIRFEYDVWGFPAFNLADSSLFCGAAIWIFFMIYDYRLDVVAARQASATTSGNTGSKGRDG